MKSLRRGFLVLVGWTVLGTAIPRVVAQQPAAGPVYVVTFVDVSPANGGVAKMNQLLLEYAAASRKGKGCVRMELLVQDGRANHTVIQEVWESRAAFEAHKATEYAKKFREGLQPMLGSPFDERLHALLQ